MVKFQEIFKVTQGAYAEGMFYELLTGQNGYDVPLVNVPVDIPTDWTSVIPNGIYKLYVEKKDEGVKVAYHNAIAKMIKGTSTELWMAANVLFYQLRSQKNGTAPFTIDGSIIENFSEQLVVKREELVKDTSYGGEQFSQGLWDDIERLNRILTSKYSVSMVN